jgi:protein TonB
MTDNWNNTPGFDDLIFEKRNREYGAFQLRKRYNRVVITGVLVASMIVSAAVVIPFMSIKREDKVLAGGARYVNVQLEDLSIPEDEIFIPPAPPPPQAAQTQEIVKYVPPVVVDSVSFDEKPIATNDEVLAQPDNQDLEITGVGTSESLIPGLGSGEETDEPFVIVEIMPMFRGGDINKFREWVQKRTTYPQLAIDNRIQGKVLLTFIVEPDGSISNVTVLKSVDPLIDNEAIKAIESSPKWSPGYQRGKPVRVRYSMWLNFQI